MMMRWMIDMLIADLPQQWAWWGWYLTCWLLTTVREVLLTSPASIRSRRPTCSQSESSADLGLYAFKRINQLGNSSQDTKILFLYRGLGIKISFAYSTELSFGFRAPSAIFNLFRLYHLEGTEDTNTSLKSSVRNHTTAFNYDKSVTAVCEILVNAHCALCKI